MKLRVSRRLRLFLVLSATMLGAVVLGFFSMPWWLITPSSTEAAQVPAAEVLIHWAAAPRSQADDWVAQLYQQGKAKQIVCVSTPVSWDLYAADFARQHLIDLGVPAEQVLTLHLEQEACAAPNIKRIAAYVKSQGWQSALLVTVPIAASSRLEKYFQREGVKLTLSSSPRDRAELTASWWKTHWKMQVMIEAVVTIMLDSAYAECR